MSELRVLVVDDEDDVRGLVRYLLQQTEGFEVVGEAANGREAVDLVAAERPDIVLLDLRMPVMDGADAIPAIRERSPDTRIVVFTADQTAEVEGVDAQVIKGASMAEVLSSLAEAPSRR
ncbi:MAG: response regulator transcription factor [Actinobacteria bacterium]|nr:MAG: response regulator transcription factor [Actinomycetota bacterium]